MEKIKSNVKRASINRITIRRWEAFQDYLDSKRKKWFTEGAILKINFAGEPPQSMVVGQGESFLQVRLMGTIIV